LKEARKEEEEEEEEETPAPLPLWEEEDRMIYPPLLQLSPVDSSRLSCSAAAACRQNRVEN
jgi:hypothetical protein